MAEEKQEKKIRGRVVALWETGITFILLILGLAGVGDFREGWVKMGDTYAFIFLGTLGLFWTKQAATTIGEAFAKAKEIALKAKEEASYEKTV